MMARNDKGATNKRKSTENLSAWTVIYQPQLHSRAPKSDKDSATIMNVEVELKLMLLAEHMTRGRSGGLGATRGRCLVIHPSVVGHFRFRCTETARATTLSTLLGRYIAVKD